MITILYHSKDEICFFRTVVLAFLIYVYLGCYRCLNMGNLNMLRERTPQACLSKGSEAGCHTRWRGLEFNLIDGIPDHATWCVSLY